MTRSIDNGKGTSGFCFKLQNSSRAFSRDIKLQNCVYTSTAEAELNAEIEKSKEVVHLADLIPEID